jgi:hypothetical protein
MDKRLGAQGAARYLELHQGLGEQILRTLHRLAEQRALRLNRLGLVVGQAYLDLYQALKAERGGLDFSDGELEAAKLLEDEDAAAAVLMKLDCRWKHLLLDEFQDTNPLQWRILRAWLEAYGLDGTRPTVFMVGDPKQSIYRFRRAEPRLFEAASKWLERRFAARRFPHNETRRCAPRVVAWVNALFEEREDYPGFARHVAHQTGLPGWCEAHAAPRDEREIPHIPFRNPLLEPPPVAPHKRAAEAAWVAARIRDVVDHLLIGDGAARARYADILVLYATRADLAVFENAFRQAGIPYLGDRRGGLLDTLEARDLAALLTVLVTPLDDLALAHCLKSPMFAFTDADLSRLAREGGQGRDRKRAGRRAPGGGGWRTGPGPPTRRPAWFAPPPCWPAGGIASAGCRCMTCWTASSTRRTSSNATGPPCRPICAPACWPTWKASSACPWPCPAGAIPACPASWMNCASSATRPARTVPTNRPRPAATRCACSPSMAPRGWKRPWSSSSRPTRAAPATPLSAWPWTGRRKTTGRRIFPCTAARNGAGRGGTACSSGKGPRPGGNG